MIWVGLIIFRPGIHDLSWFDNILTRYTWFELVWYYSNQVYMIWVGLIIFWPGIHCVTTKYIKTCVGVILFWLIMCVTCTGVVLFLPSICMTCAEYLHDLRWCHLILIGLWLALVRYYDSVYELCCMVWYYFDHVYICMRVWYYFDQV